MLTFTTYSEDGTGRQVEIDPQAVVLVEPMERPPMFRDSRTVPVPYQHGPGCTLTAVLWLSDGRMCEVLDPNRNAAARIAAGKEGRVFHYQTK